MEAEIKTVRRGRWLRMLVILTGLTIGCIVYYGEVARYTGALIIWIKDRIDSPDYQMVKSFGIRIPTNYSVHGIDVSRYQQQIDWNRVQQMEDSGVRLRFAFIKATEGRALVDPYFSRNWTQSAEHGLMRGAYHYFSPGRPGKAQAELYLQTVDFQPGDLPPVLDVEERGRQSPEALRDNVREWLQTVEQATGQKPIIYSGADFYKRHLAGYFDDYPYWIAHYYEERPDVGDLKWHFWQHSDSGQVNGINGQVDFNVFRGSIEELRAMGKGRQSEIEMANFLPKG